MTLALATTTWTILFAVSMIHLTSELIKLAALASPTNQYRSFNRKNSMKRTSWMVNITGPAHSVGESSSKVKRTFMKVKANRSRFIIYNRKMGATINVFLGTMTTSMSLKMTVLCAVSSS